MMMRRAGAGETPGGCGNIGDVEDIELLRGCIKGAGVGSGGRCGRGTLIAMMKD